MTPNNALAILRSVDPLAATVLQGMVNERAEFAHRNVVLTERAAVAEAERDLWRDHHADATRALVVAEGRLAAARRARNWLLLSATLTGEPMIVYPAIYALDDALGRTTPAPPFAAWAGTDGVPVTRTTGGVGLAGGPQRDAIEPEPADPLQEAADAESLEGAALVRAVERAERAEARLAAAREAWAEFAERRGYAPADCKSGPVGRMFAALAPDAPAPEPAERPNVVEAFRRLAEVAGDTWEGGGA